jgi:hypothetical protein
VVAELLAADGAAELDEAVEEVEEGVEEEPV